MALATGLAGQQRRTATGENLSHVHCTIPASRGAKVHFDKG